MKKTRWYFKNNIKNILVMSFILITIVPIIFISVYSYLKLQDNIKENYYEDSKQVITGFDSNLNIYFSEIEKITTKVFKSKNIQEALSDVPKSEREKLENNWKLDAYFNDLVGDRTDIKHIVMYSNTNIVYEKRNIDIKNTQTTDEEVLKILSKNNGKFVVYGSRKSDYYEDKYHYFVTVGRQLKDLNSGKVIGYIVFDIGYDVISKIINDKASSNQILVIDKSGYVLFDKENTSNITKPYSDLKEYNGVAEGINEKKYITKLDSKELGWTYITITDTNDLFGTLNGIAKNLILLSSLCFVVFLIISIGISNNISRPLKVLEGAMEKAESNDFNEIVTNKRTYDEVNHLTRRFNVMLVEIQRLIDSEKEVQKKKANSDYKALQMQITPHFLYNSLESINCLAQIHGKQDISEMILSLADIFKYSMRLDSRYVMLEEEINHVKNYCMLQAVRYQDKFRIIYDIPDAYLSQKVVKFMLQPIVENAIGHGMKNIEKNGEIVISVLEVNEELIVSVTDNGDGISKHKIDEINELLNQDINEIYQYNSKKGSIGLTNVHLRLKLSFGQQAGLSIFSREGKGAKISIHIPTEKRGDTSV